jgi:hypothetical protein
MLFRLVIPQVRDGFGDPRVCRAHNPYGPTLLFCGSRVTPNVHVV